MRSLRSSGWRDLAGDARASQAKAVQYVRDVPCIRVLGAILFFFGGGLVFFSLACICFFFFDACCLPKSAEFGQSPTGTMQLLKSAACALHMGGSCFCRVPFSGWFKGKPTANQPVWGVPPF